MSSSPNHDETTSQSKELIEAGSEIAGAAVGGALGLLGGPLGVAAGAAGGVAATRALKRVGSELHERLLAPRQRVRVGGALAFATDEIRAKLEAGEQPRQDWFSDTGAEPRVEAEELLEGVLLHSADAYEERKVKHLGWVYAGLSFDPDIGRGYANFLLRVADRMTYRQLVLLALFGTPEIDKPLVILDVARGEGTSRSSDAIAAELSDLGQMGVIGFVQDNANVVPPQATYGGGDFRTASLGKTGPTSIGRDLYRLMRLDRVPQEDLADVALEVGGGPGFLVLPTS